MKTLHKVILIALILSSCVGCDQVTKTTARNHLASSQPVRLMGDVVRLQYSENRGAILSLGAGLPESVRFWSLTVLVGIVLIGMLFFLVSTKVHTVNIAAASLIIGGGFSNLLDRLFNDGAAVDFMNVGVSHVRTGIFNFADVAIMIGVGTLVFWNTLFRDSNAGPSI
jgi:signal peptidase II